MPIQIHGSATDLEQAPPFQVWRPETKVKNCSPQRFLPSGEVFLHMQSPQHGAGLSLL